MTRKFYLVSLVAILFVAVSGCGVKILIPDLLLVKQAIALQITLDQQQVNQELLVSETLPKLELARVTISHIEPMVIQNLESYRIRGSYDLKIKLPRRHLTQKQNPFDVYLQRQQRGETWRLARPQIGNQNGEIIWLTYLIRRSGSQFGN